MKKELQVFLENPILKHLVICVIAYNIVSNLISLGIAIQTTISRIFSYKDQKAKKCQLEECQKIVDSVWAEIDFLKNSTGTFHSADDKIEVSWRFKVTPNPTVSFHFKFLEELEFEATNCKELQWWVKLKIENQEMCEIQAFDEFTRSLNDLSDPVLNLSLCFFVSLFI